jgi:hypothetical protein
MNTSPKHNFYLKVALLITFFVFVGWASYGPVSGVAATEESAAPEPIMVAQADKPKGEKVSPILDPSDPKSVLYLDTSGKLAGTGDPTKPVSEAFKAGMGWHPKALAAEGLPRDKYGLVMRSF